MLVANINSVAMKKSIKVNELKEVTPPGLDGHRYLMSFDVGSLSDGIFKPDQTRQVTITSSGTLQAVWGQDDSQLAESSASAAASIVMGLITEGRADEIGNIDLNTYTAPDKPPSKPKAIAGTIIPIPGTPPTEKRESPFSFLSDDISEVRDQINAISKGLLGERLLELPQERAILDVYKPAHTVEEFRARVQSLAGVCVALNKKAIGKGTGNSNTKETGSIVLLSGLLERYSNDDEAKKICDVLKNINELRKGYPAHGDNTPKFLMAHTFFKIKYPIVNYQLAWESVLGAYFQAMKQLLKVLSSEWENRI